MGILKLTLLPGGVILKLLEAEGPLFLQVMDLVELTPLRGALVGLPGSTGLSVEQRKRLTIAVELVANPSIIFMDEPTTGARVPSPCTLLLPASSRHLS